MHRMGNQIADALQHRTMACQTREAEKVLGHDRDRKVPSAGFAAGVSGMLGAVVLNIENRRRERGKTRLECGGNAHGAGSDTWRASTTPCASANSRNSPMPPHTLKFTHVSV